VVLHTNQTRLRRRWLGGGRRLQRIGDAGSSERRARAAVAVDADVAALASMFRTDRQAGLAFPTAVLPFNCDSDEHAGRAICRSAPGARPLAPWPGTQSTTAVNIQ
jgi:hypothetical protein